MYVSVMVLSGLSALFIQSKESLGAIHMNIFSVCFRLCDISDHICVSVFEGSVG